MYDVVNIPKRSAREVSRSFVGVSGVFVAVLASILSGCGTYEISTLEPDPVTGECPEDHAWVEGACIRERLLEPGPCPDDPERALQEIDGYCFEVANWGGYGTCYDVPGAVGRGVFCTELERGFDSLEVLGLAPQAGSCGGSDGSARLRFIALDADRQTIRPGVRFEHRDIGETGIQVEFSEPRYFDTEPGVCSTSLDCDGESMMCSEWSPSQEQVCQRALDEISVTSPSRYISPAAGARAFGVLVENTASMSGRLPRSIVGLALDHDGDDRSGDDVSPGVYGLENPDRATDPSNSRSALVGAMEQPWEVVASLAARDGHAPVLFNLWTFGEGVYDIEDGSWASAPDDVASALSALREEPETDEHASVYASIKGVIEAEEGFSGLGDEDEKLLVVIVDGPDDVRDPTLDHDAIIDLATANNVKLFIIQIDSDVSTRDERTDLPLLPDLPGYVAFQGECSADTDCKDFEVCREVSTYSTRVGGEVTLPEGKTGGTYCAIDRDENGRIGPIGDYAELACATGGQYFYVDSNEFLDARFSWMPFALNGFWEVDVDLGLSQPASSLQKRAYRVGAMLQFDVGGASERFNMSADFTDRRATLFVGE